MNVSRYSVSLLPKRSRKIFELLDGEAMYLSTNLCPAHRREIIREMKTRLRDGKPCRVVSTSIISVGVDIDFPVVYLQYTGLDSLIQGAGRCNREGRQSLQKAGHTSLDKGKQEEPIHA